MEVEKMKQGRIVLIVDDDPDILLYLSEFLDSKGYTTLTDLPPLTCSNVCGRKGDHL